MKILSEYYEMKDKKAKVKASPENDKVVKALAEAIKNAKLKPLFIKI